MAQVTVDVKTRLVDNDLRKATYDIKRSFDGLGRDAGNAFGQNFAVGAERGADHVTAAMDRSATAVVKVQKAEENLAKALKSNDFEDVIRAQDRLVKVRREAATQDDRLAASTSRLAASMAGEFTNAATTASNSVEGLTSAFSGLGKAVGPAAIAVAGQALLTIAEVASSAAQSVWLLPAAVGAAGAGFLSLKIATAGFGDALKDIRDPEKFAADLQSLSPNAQQAATSLQGLLPVFDQLKAKTQDALFSEVGPQITALAGQYTPAIEQMTTSIAGAFNTAFSGIAGQLGTGETQSAIQAFMKNTGTAFDELAQAAAPLTKALANIMATGSDFLPDIAKGAADAAKAFSEFVTEAQKSGQLHDWLSDGLDTLKTLGQIAWDLGRAFVNMNTDSAKADLKDFAATIKELADDMSVLIDALTTVKNLAMTIINPLEGARGFARQFGIGGDDSPGPQGSGLSREANTNAVANIMGPFGSPNTAPVGAPGIGSLLGSLSAGTPGQTAAPMFGVGTGILAEINAFNSATGLWGQNPYAVGSGSGGGGAAARPDVAVPYGADPMSLIQGMPVTASLYQSAQSVIESQHKLATDQAILNALNKDNTATEADIQKAKNDVLKDQQDQHEAELRLAEAKKAATDSQLKSTKDVAQAFSSLTAGLDSDLGLSKGLSGLADNLVRFVGKLIAAPELAKLNAQGAGDPSKTGSGIIGMLAPTPSAGGAAATPQDSYGSTAAWQPGGNVAAMMNLAQMSSGNTKYAAASDLVHGLADCSGSISDLVEVLQTGQSGPGRLFDTTSFANDAEAAKVGALPGYMPGALNVGVNPYPGQSGHMAATLPNGVNFEGGGGTGGGAQYGGSASGALDPQFLKHYYFPTGAGVPTGPTAADLYNPANTNPALNNPVAPGAGGGPGPIAGNQPQGYPMPANPVGPVQYAPPAAPAWQPSGGGYKGVGGAPMAALSAATSMIPGAGAAAETASQLINRTVGFAGQAASIGISGLLETFGLGDTLGNLQNSWPGRILSGFAGAGAALPNSAGENKTPMQSADDGKKAVQAEQAKPGGPTVHIENYTQAPGRSDQGAAKELAYLSYAKGGR